jgi:F0F1-type ATP synthase assembly protein I
MPDDNDKQKRENADAIYQAVSLGFLFPVAIAVGFFLGRWLDGVFHTWPWLTIIFTALGIAAAFVNLFRSARAGDE